MVLVVSIVVLAIAGFSVWFFVFHKAIVSVTEQPVPSGTIVVTATPMPVIETVFPVAGSVNLPVTSSFFAGLKDIADQQLTSIGKTGLYRVLKSAGTGGENYTFSEFMAASGVEIPQDILSSVDDSTFYVTVIGQNI